jgi:3-oxoacyl-[acyl-carrier protein] reductase
MTTANDSGRAAIVHGCGNTLGKAVALELARRKVRLGLYEPGPSASQLAGIQAEVQAAGGDAHLLQDCAVADDREEGFIGRAAEKLGRLDVLVNVFVPDPQGDPQELYGYPIRLLARGLAAANHMAAAKTAGTIVSHCFLPSMYAGTRFDVYMPELKGSITGVTRTLCRQFGRAGIRATCVQTGLLDMPETKAVASPEVLQVKVPVGRWGTPEEVARLMVFLALDNGYISGQVLILDGGLTAGITGT